MPELPEVEGLARFLAARATGHRVARVDVVSFAALKTVTPRPSDLVGRVVSGAFRRGKFLVIETSPGVRVAANGEGDGVPSLYLAMHFSRGGWLAWRDPAKEPAAAGAGARPASHGGAELRAASSSRPRLPRPGGPLALRVGFEDGAEFDVTEAGTPKRLALYVVTDPEQVPGIARLGIDPFDPAFDAERLGALLAGGGGQLKHVLSDQAVIAGVGNAYSDEALHAARLSPFKPANRLSPDEVARLHDALVSLLADAVTRSSGLRASELKAEKKSGMRVHGRTGLPCPVCGDTVREVSFSDRSLQYCPTCQTGGKPLADRRLSRLLK